jgi:hypothetical protein
MNNGRCFAAGDGLALAVALAAGAAVGWIDSRPGWDDTGVTVGALLLASGALAAARPRAWWGVALATGLPVPLFNGLAGGGFASVAALPVTLVAAGVGGLVGRTLRPRDAGSTGGA